MSDHNSLVATFANRHLAESTVRKLQGSGLGNSKLSIVCKARERVTQDMEGATVFSGLDELSSEQASCIPPDNLLDYEAELQAGRTIAVMHGSADDITQAKHIIDQTHPEGWNGKVGCSIYYGCVD